MSASAIGLPSGGSATLTLTVNGVATSYEANVSSDGNVSFSIPVVKSGSEVIAQLDIRDSSGTLLLTGKTSKTVTDSDNNIAITLSDSIEVPITTSFSASGCVYKISCGSTVQYESGASTSCTAQLGSSLTVSGWTLVGNGIYKLSEQTLTVSEGSSIRFTSYDSSTTFSEANITLNLDNSYYISYNASYPSGSDLGDFTGSNLFSFTPSAFYYKTSATQTEWTQAAEDTQTGWLRGYTYPDTPTSIRMDATVTLGGASVSWTKTRIF